MGHNQSSSGAVERLRSWRRRRKASKTGSEGSRGNSAKRKGKNDPSSVKRKATASTTLLSETEIGYIQDSWPHMEMELAEVLTEAFLTLFSEHPRMKEKFFQSYSSTSSNTKAGGGGGGGGGLGAPRNGRAHSSVGAPGDLLQRHIPKVIRAISKAANNVDDLEPKTADYFQIVGKLHCQKGFHLVDMALLGPYVVSSAVRHLPSHLRGRHYQEAWLKFFSALNELMGRGYPEIEFKLTAKEKSILRDTFASIRTAAGGEAAILKLFQTYSSSSLRGGRAKLTAPEDELALSQAMENHGLLLLKMVEELMTLLDKEERFRNYLISLGTFHAKAGVRGQHVDVMGPFFCQTIRPVLQAESRWNGETRQTWTKFFRIISYYMKKGYDRRTKEDESEAADDKTIILSCRPRRLSNVDVDESNFLSPTHHQHLFQKNRGNPRRVSTGELHDPRRGVRLPPAHCHAYHQSRTHETRLSISSLSVVNDIHDYGGDSPRTAHHRGGGGGVTGRFLDAPKHQKQQLGRQLSRSDVDLRMLSIGGSNPRFFSTSSGVVNSTSGCSSAMLIMCNEAAAKAEAEAKAKRRGSLHQLIGLSTKSTTLGSGSSLAKSRPRSKSTTLTDQIINLVNSKA